MCILHNPRSKFRQEKSSPSGLRMQQVCLDGNKMFSQGVPFSTTARHSFLWLGGEGNDLWVPETTYDMIIHDANGLQIGICDC